MGAQNVANLHRHQSELQGNAAAELLKLQLEQFRHDETYHREIARLTVQHRLSHMVLHFVKYTGAVAQDDVADDKLDRVIIDAIIIGLSTANILNLKLADRLIEKDETFPNLVSLAMHMVHLAQINEFDRSWLLKKLAISVGKMAKGCESIDHLESFPFREAITDNLVEVMKALLVAAALRRTDVPKAVRYRLAGVKTKSIFHGLL